MLIKVQIVNSASVKSALEADTIEKTREPLTFHAYSDAMKARMLEQFLKSPAKIGISICDDAPRNGEWHEPLIESALFNR